MTKSAKPPRSSATDQWVTVQHSDASRVAKTKFGSVIVQGEKPSKARVEANVAFSSLALERVGRNLLNPGISLRPKKDVPQYSAVEGQPGVFVRRLNGTVSRGQMVDGVFRVVD